MGRSIRVAAVQLRAHDRADFPRSLNPALDAAEKAALRADLVVLPEGSFPAYVLLGDDRSDETAVSGALQRLSEIAARTRTVFVAGAAVRDGSELHNSAVVIDADGRLAGRADKFFLWHFDRRWFHPGQRLEPVDTALGKIGALVCADGRLPTIASRLVDRGACILAMPTAWVTSGRDPAALENVQADLLARVRAYENAVPFVAANKCGSELGMVAYCGKSQIVDARGAIVAIAGERDGETLVGTVDLGGEVSRRNAAPAMAPATPASVRALRLAVSNAPLPADTDTRLDALDDAFALAPRDRPRFDRLAAVIPSVLVDDAHAFDPTCLAAYRRGGYRLAVWEASNAGPWTTDVARARALELRMYVVVLSQDRSFAVDPDGAVVCGTFGDYRLASFSLDVARTDTTLVAPGTDVLEGLERAAGASGEAPSPANGKDSG